MFLVSTFSNSHFSGSIYYGDLKYTVKGKMNMHGVYDIEYKAAAPADLRLSYSGSGLPFATVEQAYEDTPNRGTVTTQANGEFELTLFAPNSYYICQGIDLVRPHVHLVVKNNTSGMTQSYNLKLGPGIPNRSLRHLDGRPNRSYGR